MPLENEEMKKNEDIEQQTTEQAEADTAEKVAEEPQTAERLLRRQRLRRLLRNWKL